MLKTTLTVNIQNEKDLTVLQEILNRFGLTYSIDTIKEYNFLEEEIKGFVQIRKDYLEGKTTARDWNDIEDELNNAYN